jgi:hypothetical protein
MMGWFGHVHNDDAWELIAPDHDGANMFLHTNFIYSLYSDTSYTPYSKFEIFPNNGMWQARASYDKEDTGFKSAWTGGRSWGNHESQARKQFRENTRNRSWYNELYFPDDNSALVESLSNGSLTDNDGHNLLQVNGGGGNNASVEYKQGYRFKKPIWEKNTFAFETSVKFNQNSAQTIWLLWGLDSTFSHMGFKLDNDELKGTVADGSTETTISIDTGVSAGTAYRGLKCVSKPGDWVRFWVNDGYRGEITSNLPTQAKQTEYVMQIRAETSDANPKGVEWSWWKYMIDRDDTAFNPVR